jgi:predicted AAA+ superfamily ATPase
VKRIVDTSVATALEAVGAVVLEGPKACGKTETARQHAASEVLLDIDPEAQRAAAIDARLLLTGSSPRLIDEWQREPLIWDAVRREVDSRRLPGQFILTGSATLRDSVSRHSGAGRMTTVAMRPMTLFEQGFSPGSVSLAALLEGQSPPGGASELHLSDYADRIVVGGWPALIGRPVSAAMAFTSGYIDNIVEHDIDVVSGARRNPRLVRRFLQSYAQLSAHPARLSTIVDRAGAATNDEAPSRWTAEPYLDALTRLMVVDDIEAWNPELRSRSRLMSTPKRHLADPSLASALMECGPTRLLADLNTMGYLFESLVARDVRVYASAANASVFHYRERGGELEVDLIVERRDGAWIGIEVKMGSNLIDEAARSLLRLASARVVRPPNALLVLTATEYSYRRDDGVGVVPLGLLGP